MSTPEFKLQPEHLTLYIRPYCGYCTRVLMALEEMNLLGAIAQENISLNHEAKKELVEGGGMSQVPALRIKAPNQETQWMYESLDIIRYLQQHLAMTQA